MFPRPFKAFVVPVGHYKSYSTHVYLGLRMITFDLRIRFILLRAICLSAFVSIFELILTWQRWPEWHYYYLSLVLAPITFAHHILRCVLNESQSRFIYSLAGACRLCLAHSVLV